MICINCRGLCVYGDLISDFGFLDCFELGVSLLGWFGLGGVSAGREDDTLKYPDVKKYHTQRILGSSIPQQMHP